MSRTAGVATRGQRGRGGLGDPDRSGAALRDRAVVALRPEELLLPGHAEGLPDQPVRRAHRPRRVARRRPRGRVELPSAHRAGPHGGGHRQVAARRRRDRADPRCGVLARGLQPCGHSAHRDRHETADRHGGAGARDRPRLRVDPARAAAGARGLGREDGAGLAAVRRQRLAHADRHDDVRHPHRDEERQFAALDRAGRPLRDDPSCRGAGLRRPGAAGDPALARGHRRDDVGAREVRRGGLPVLPRA